MKIPSDIMTKAEALYDALGRGSDADAQMIARAILAERQRCAEVAFNTDMLHDTYALHAARLADKIEAGE